MQISKFLLSAVAIASATGLSSTAQAVVIDFDSQGYTGPSVFASASPQDITISTVDGDVTFTGGTILTNTTSLPANTTSLYGTASFGNGLINPITITFASPINNFFMNLYNGLTTDQTYTVADNLGNSTTVTLAPNLSSGVSLISFPALGNVVTITADARTPFDFFIDNIGFNQPTPGTVPEPATWMMMLVGFGLVGAALRRRTTTSVSYA